MVLEGRLSLADAAEQMGISYRHAKRLKKSFREKGIDGLSHGNRGRSPINKIDEQLRARIVSLSLDEYAQFNDTHFAEMLAEHEGVLLSRETIRAIRRVEGIRPKCRRRSGKHHKRRPRKACEGAMILWDGSPHRWFGSEHDPCCAMAAIDDATGGIAGLFFVEAECSWAYLELLRRVVSEHGIPIRIVTLRLVVMMTSGA